MVLDRIKNYFSGWELQGGKNEKTIKIYDPEARGATTNLVLSVGAAALVTLLAVEIGLLPEDVGEWVVLGAILSLMVVNPLIRLSNFWEGIVILLMYADFMAYLIIYHPDNARNVVLISFAVLIVAVIFEYPRRFEKG